MPVENIDNIADKFGVDFGAGVDAHDDALALFVNVGRAKVEWVVEVFRGQFYF